MNKVGQAVKRETFCSSAKTMTKTRPTLRRLETPQLNIEDTPILAADDSFRGEAHSLLTFAQISCNRDSGRERGGSFSIFRERDVAIWRFAFHVESLIGCDGDGLDRDWLDIDDGVNHGIGHPRNSSSIFFQLRYGDEQRRQDLCSG